ncbi:unnamed protein product [Thelazia callipaeda]|uniref:C2H2-type domain-containing protein n=1 Tax=Thelazia callipaeda TaxID=103827 RepID=A0A0N5DB19_THECL|nr:unnamed protein product [Thelazia callipaeda]
MSRNVDDLGVLQSPILIGGSMGLDGLVELYSNSTVEVRNLLANECLILFECRSCTNIFRSPVNYLTHKRAYCRNLHASALSAFRAITLEYARRILEGKIVITEAQIEKSKNEGAQQPNKGEAGTSSDTKTDAQPTKRTKGILKRTNLVNVVNKRSKHYAMSLPNSEHKLELHTLPRISRDVATTTFVEGQQILESIPLALISTDSIPSDRVPVIIPQDNSSRYREMNLRNRKGDSSKNGIARKVGSEEIVKESLDCLVTTVCDDIENSLVSEIITESKPQLEQDDNASKSQARPKRRRQSKEKEQPSKGMPVVLKKKNLSLLTSRKRTLPNEVISQEAGSDKDAQESDGEEKRETVLPKKRGRGRKPKSKVDHPVKNDSEKDDFSGNSDEAEEGGRKQRPSRQRRKPNWIDENYVTGFKVIVIFVYYLMFVRNKRARRDDDDVDYDFTQNKGQSRPSSRAGSKCAKSIDSNSQRSTPVESSGVIPGVPSDVSSEETSSSSSPAPQEDTSLVLLIVASTKNNVFDDTTVQSSLHSSTVSESHDSENNGDTAIKRTCRLQYTPRARRMKYGEDLSSLFDEEDPPCTSSADVAGPSNSEGGNSTSNEARSQSRRKQDLSTIRENNDEVMIVRFSNGEASLPKDLSEIPVYLTETQRDLFFSFIHPASPSSDGASSVHKCMQCGEMIANISEGRRHAVSHLRIMRLRCALCNCGSFFCSDMRTHLQYRHCEKLYLAPKGFVLPGNIVPCMTQRQADDLTRVVDPMKPGRVMYTSGKIISSTNPKPYYPDPVIESRVLGALLPEITSSDEQVESVPTSSKNSNSGSSRPF